MQRVVEAFRDFREQIRNSINGLLAFNIFGLQISEKIVCFGSEKFVLSEIFLVRGLVGLRFFFVREIFFVQVEEL